MEKKLNDVLDDSIRQVRELVDANTSVGAPIALGDGITLVPISKISVGLASGGGDFPSKSAPTGPSGAGMGCGLKVVPVAMLVIQGDRVRLLPVGEPASNAVERAIDQLPVLVDKISDLIRSRSVDIN